MTLAKGNNFMNKQTLKLEQKQKLLELEAIDKSCYSETLEPVFPECKRAIVFESSAFLSHTRVSFCSLY